VCMLTFCRPWVTAALSFLEEIADFTTRCAGPDYVRNIIIPLTRSQKPNQMAEIQSYVCKIAPFGAPLDTNLNNITTMVRQGFPVAEGLTIKVKCPRKCHHLCVASSMETILPSWKTKNRIDYTRKDTGISIRL
jgi:hypothetical protein